MTTLRTAVGPWSVRPGWGIAVDLTPPQLVRSRRVRIVRKLVAAGLGLVVVGCAIGYFVATHERTTAQDSLAGAQLKDTQLQSAIAKYATITLIHGTVAGVRQQISAVMAGDVSTDDLLVRIRTALPSDMTIQQASVTVSQASVAGVAPDDTGTTGLNDAAHPRVGDVTINGTGKALTDVSTFVDSLERERGIVDVIPTTDSADKTSVQYSVTFGFTDQLQTHAYDLTQPGAK